jgi:hypothetical protein
MIEMKTAIILAMGLFAQTPPPQANTTPATSEAKPIAPEFMTALQKSEQAMDSLKQFSVTARLTSSLEGPDSKQGSTSTQTIVVKRPGKVLIKADWGQFGETTERPQLRVLLDGDRLTTYFVPTKLVSTHEGTNAAEMLAGEAIIASTLEGSGLHVLTMPDMAKFVIAHTDEARLLGNETIDNVECQKFEVTYSGLKLQMWMGPINRPLLRQLSESTIIAQDEKSKLISSRLSKISWRLDQEIPDTEFQLPLPENSRKVANILEAVSQGQQESPTGKPLPEVSLKNGDNKELKTKGLKGKSITLVFWASWINSPESVLKHAAKLNTARKEGETVYLVNVGETPEKVADLLKTVKDLPESLFDSEEDLAIDLRLKGIPAVVNLNEQLIVKSVKNSLDQ